MEVEWTDILEHMQAHHSGIARSWFDQLKPGDMQGGQLTIIAANAAQLTYLNEHCMRPFVEAAQAATGRLVTVQFANGGPDEPMAPHSDLSHDAKTLSFEKESSLLRLNGDYVFDNFVVGPCNRLAHASCLAISEAPGKAYNPLFLHGKVGLGKTHLLQAVCHSALDRAPETRVMYLSCETFVNHFIEAVEKGAMDSFRYRYRYVDILVIDDIQFLARRDRTQEEFFHTFNTLYQLQKQIILSADSPPSEIPSLEERLVSRFNWGLVTRLDTPCLETRAAIIRKKAAMRKMDVPEKVVLFVASRVQANTRELEGALNRLHGMASLEDRQIDMALASEVFGEEEPGPQRQIRIQDIMNAVTEQFDVKLSDLQGRRRSRSVVLPRQVCMYLARQLTHHSLEEIGGFFGGRDHTTVLHANKLITNRRNEDPQFSMRVAAIETVLR